MTSSQYPPSWLLIAILLVNTMTSRVMGMPDVCSADYEGGAVCSCYDNAGNQSTAACSERNLPSIPRPFLSNTSVIILSNNAITDVWTGPFNGLTELADIYLQRNYISYLHPGVFARLMKLQQIILAHNYIRSIEKGVFSHLPSLSVLDLSNNLIATINRHSFMYLPSLVLVNMANNSIECGCEEKLLKEFMDLKLGQMSLTNALCKNFGNVSITDVSTSTWSSLSQCEGETLFRPVGENQCYTCAAAKGIFECQEENRLQPCFGSKDVCYSRAEYSNNHHLGVWGGCIDYQTCISTEAQNYRTCQASSPATCYFCNVDERFRKQDIVNTTRSFNLWVLVTLSMDMTAGLADNTTTEYRNFVNNIHVEFQNNLYGLNGSHLVEFIELRAPRVTIVLKVTSSTVWFVKRNQITSAITNTLLNVRYYGKPVEDVDVFIRGWCEAEVVENETYGTLSWQRKISNSLAVLPCPFLATDDVTYATRFCNASGVWSVTNFTQCLTASQISNQLQQIASQDITDENVEEVSETISDVSENWEEYRSVDVSLTVDILEEILDTTSPSPSVLDNILDTVNNLLFVSPQTLSEAQGDRRASTRLASAIDDFSNNVNVTNNDYTLVKENVAMFVSNIADADDFDGRSMSLGNNNDDAFSSSKTSFHTSEDAPGTGQSGIVLHETLLDGLTATQRSRVSQVSLYALWDSKLYNSITDLNTTREIELPGNKTVIAKRAINSNVISANVPGVTINNLDVPVKITFRHFYAAVNPECVYWDEANSEWVGDGCTVNVSTTGLTECHCNHLTNFALLMDVYGTGGKLTKSDLLALSIISYIGCGLSCLGVVLTLFTYAYFKRIKKDNPSKILMNLCVAIGLVNLVFVIGVQDYTSQSLTGCKIVGVLLHYLLLAIMCWMMVEAFYMYLALVKVFNTHMAHFQLKSSIFGWGVPLLVVIVTLSVTKGDSYGIQPGGICWLERVPFYAAFLGPVCVTMVVNFVVFTLVLRQIFRRSSKKLTKSDSKRGTAVRVRGAISLVILLGLTWLFAILAIGDFGKVFHYLFALTNTLQGLFIFIFYCVLKTEAQAAWKMCLPCCKTPYEHSRTTIATSKGKRLERDVHERLVASDTTSMMQHKSEGYSETESSSKSTNSTDLTAASTSYNGTQKKVPKPEPNPKNAKSTVFRGNWQMNISANRSTSFEA